MDEKPLRGRPLDDEIRSYIKRYILESELGPGDALPPESQLAQKLGVGRGTVREAIKALEALGIVAVRRGEGMFVRESNFDPLVQNLTFGLRFETSTLLDLAQIRTWLETEIVEQATRRMRPEHIVWLEAVLEAWRQGVAACPVDMAFIAAQDKSFHRGLYTPLDNTILIKFLEAFWVIFFNFLGKYIEPSNDLADHVRILDAVRSGDGAAAHGALLQNLTHMQERVRRLSESGQQGNEVPVASGSQNDKPYRRPMLSEAIRQYVTQYILDRGLAPGDALPSEGQLAQELGVARTSVREAIKALESLGIIEVRHGEGLYVRQYNFDPILEALSYGVRFDARTLIDLLQIRIWLEGAAIVEAIDRITEAEVQKLEAIIERWEEALLSGQITREVAAVHDEEFHRSLYSSIHNATLTKLLEVFWIVFAEYIGPYRSEFNVDLADHVAILNAVKARDRAAARQAVLTNVRRNQERMQALAEARRDA